MADNTILDLESILDTNMEAVETLPDYVTPGKSILDIKVHDTEIKKSIDKETGADKRAIVLTYEIIATVESEEPAFPDGSRFTERFQATEDGLKYFKKQAMKLLNVSDLTGATLRDILEGLKGTEVRVAVTQRTAKGKDGKDYTNINIRPLHDNPAA